MRKLIAFSIVFSAGLSLAQEEPNITYRPDPNTINEVLMPPSRFGKVLFDLFEYHLTSEDNEAKYDIETWYGGDFNRLWIELEGEHSLKKGEGSYDRADVYYSRLISPFWDVRIGVGNQGVYGDESESRTYLVGGFQGLAPYWFEVDANLRVDTDGKVTADLEAEQDILFTQRLILQPRFETLVSFSDIPKVGIYKGINNFELGARLRYEIRREFAPYIGVEWTQYVGDAKRALESSGEDASVLNLLLGLRLWF